MECLARLDRVRAARRASPLGAEGCHAPGDRGDGGALSGVGSAAQCVAGGQRKDV